MAGGGMRITVKEEDVALVLGPNMKLRLAIPKTDPVPYHVIFMVAIASLLSKQDKEFCSVVRKKLMSMKRAAKKEMKRKEKA